MGRKINPKNKNLDVGVNIDIGDEEIVIWCKRSMLLKKFGKEEKVIKKVEKEERKLSKTKYNKRGNQ